MFLATTAVEEFWDTSEELLYLGEWCRLYPRREIWGPLPHQVFPYPWQNAEPFRSIDAYCNDVHEIFLPALAHALNRVHGISWSVAQYRILIGSWLIYFIHQAYDKFTMLNLALKAHPQASTWVLARDQYYTPLDRVDFVKLNSDDRYQLQIYSTILRGMGLRFPERKLSNPLCAPRQWELFGKPKDALYRVGIRAAAALVRLTKRRDVAVIVQPIFPHHERWRNTIKLALRSKLRIIPDNYRYRAKISSQLNVGLRSTLALSIDGDEFKAMLSRIIPEVLPVSYLEGFDDFLRSCNAIPERNATTYFSANALHASTHFCFHMANSASGKRLVFQQHGGGYGTDAFAVPETHERACSDEYFTWGWTGERARYFPHPNIPAPAKRMRSESDVLLVMTSNHRYVVIFHSQVISSQVTPYIKRAAEFCRRLPESIPIVLRTHPMDFGWHIRDRLRDLNVRFSACSTKSNLIESVTNARICVLDNLSTTYLEVLALNRPTVIFFPPSAYLIREDAKPYFEQLRAASILHDSAESAARHVAAVYDEPLAWWDSPQVQNARSSFCERYARYDPDWVGAWVKELSP